MDVFKDLPRYQKPCVMPGAFQTLARHPEMTMISLKVTMKIMTMTATSRNIIHKIILLCFCDFSARVSSFTPSSTEVATYSQLERSASNLLEHFS